MWKCITKYSANCIHILLSATATLQFSIFAGEKLFPAISTQDISERTATMQCMQFFSVEHTFVQLANFFWNLLVFGDAHCTHYSVAWIQRHMKHYHSQRNCYTFPAHTAYKSITFRLFSFFYRYFISRSLSLALLSFALCLLRELRLKSSEFFVVVAFVFVFNYGAKLYSA